MSPASSSGGIQLLSLLSALLAAITSLWSLRDPDACVTFTEDVSPTDRFGSWQHESPFVGTFTVRSSEETSFGGKKELNCNPSKSKYVQRIPLGLSG